MKFKKTLMGAAILSAIGFIGSSSLTQATAGDIQAPTPGVVDGIDYTNQFTIGEFTKWIYAQGDVEKIGYAGQVNINQEKRTEIYWKGNSPLIERIRAEGQRRGIGVDFKPAVFSTDEQIRIGSAIMDPDQVGKFAAQGIAVDSVIGFAGVDGRVKVVGNSNDQTKVLGLDPTKAKSIMKTLVRAIVAPVIAGSDVLGLANAAALADREIDVLFDEPGYGPSVNYAGTRVANTVPTYAGALITAGSGYCSSGFALRDRSTREVNRFTTARHCRGTYWRSWEGNNQLGRSISNSSDGAALLIQGTSASRVFDGSWSNNNGYNKQVWTDIAVRLGDSVCTSGANSGVHCNLTIDNMNRVYDDGFGRFSTISAYNAGGGIAGAPGDSGGPVVMPYQGETWTAAVGMIQGGTQDRQCRAGIEVRLDGGPNWCGNRVYFTSIQTIASTSTHEVAKAAN